MFTFFQNRWAQGIQHRTGILSRLQHLRCSARTLCVMLGFLSLLTLSGCQTEKTPTDQLQHILQKGELRVGVKFDAPPFSYVTPAPDGTPKASPTLSGLEIDLVNAIAKRIAPNPDKAPLNIRFVQVLPATRLLLLNQGLVDMVAANMTITPARQKLARFSTPYFEAHQAFVVLTSTPVTSTQAFTVSTHRPKYRLGALAQSTSAEQLKQHFPHATLVVFNTQTQAIDALKAQTIDAYSNDDVLLEPLLSQRIDGTSQFRLLPERLSNEPYGIAFRLGPESITLHQAVNQAIESLQADGTMARLQKKWR